MIQPALTETSSASPHLIKGNSPAWQTGMLFLGNELLEIDPQADVSLQVHHNFEIKARIGRIATQVMHTNHPSVLTGKARGSHFATLTLCSSNSRPFKIWRLTK